MKIRNHRELLSESMQTVREIEPTIDAVRKFFKDGSMFDKLYDGVIKVEPYGFDDRIKWNTYIVTVDGKAIGFTDSPVENPNQPHHQQQEVKGSK